jgi:putative heme iron utilization protein
MKADELALVGQLIRGQRQAGLGTLADGAPFVSMVAYVAEPDFAGFLLHLSGLAPHTRQLQRDSRCSLLICEPDRPDVDDVQTLARVTLVGSAARLVRDATGYGAALKLYLDRLPAAAMLFDFADFALYRFVPTEARYVGGFARAYTLTAAQLRDAARLTNPAP